MSCPFATISSKNPWYAPSCLFHLLIRKTQKKRIDTKEKVAATKILPKHLHISAIGFAAAFGGGGAAIFPFAVGAIAQAKGVQVLQPIILALLVTILLLWLSLPKIKHSHQT